MNASLPWMLATACLALLAVGMGFWALRPRRKVQQPLPAHWPVAPRSVFSADERRVYRQLREALPHHIVLAKVPLVRFCQPTEVERVRYWFGLIGTTHVTFAVCSANGRVLAAIDLENDRSNSRRVLEIKQAVLAACQIRYLRCPIDHLPSIPELQLLVPQTGTGVRGPQPAPTPAAPSAAASRRRSAAPLWRDTGSFADFGQTNWGGLDDAGPAPRGVGLSAEAGRVSPSPTRH